MADDKLVTHLVLDGVGGYMRGLSRVEYGLNAGAKAAEDFRKRTERISQAASAVGNVGMKMMMVGGAMVAAAGMAVKAAATEEAAQDRLRKIWAAGADEVIRYAAERKKLTRFGDDETVAAAAVGATYVSLRGSMKQAIAAAQDISEAYGIDLTQSMHMLGKASGGMVTNLRRVGIMVDANDFKARGMAAVYDEVKREFSDVAVTSNSAEKALAQMRNAVGDAAETIGFVLLPYVKSGALWVKQLAERFSDLSPPVQRAIAFLIGGGGLALALGGLALKLGATVVQTWLSIAATRAYISKLREEALAAKLAAAAEADLAKARGLTWAMTGKKPTSGPSPIPPVVTPLPGGPLAVPVGLGVLIAALILAGAKGIQLALRLRDLRKDLDALTDPVQRVRRELEELEWLQADPAAQKLLSRANKERLQAAIDANRAYLANVDAARAEATAVAFAATDEGRRLEALEKRKEELRDLLQLMEMTKAQEAAGLATEQQVGEVRSAILDNMLDQWDLLTAKEKESAASRKFELEFYGQLADDVNAKEQERKDLLDAQKEAADAQTKALEDQNQAIQYQLGLLDARVGYAQAYAEYLKAVGRGGEARMVERNVIPGLQQEGAQRAFWAAGQYRGMGMEQQMWQAGSQGWRYMAEAAQGGRGRAGQIGGSTKIEVSPNWSFDRMQRDQDATVYRQSAAGVN